MTSAIANLPAKLLTARARPDLAVVPEVRRLARVPTSTSFPSGHAASATAFATAVGLEVRGARGPLGLPDGIPVYVDDLVLGHAEVIVGGGSRSLKIAVDPEVFRRMPGTEIVPGLARTPPPRE